VVALPLGLTAWPVVWLVGVPTGAPLVVLPDRLAA